MNALIRTRNGFYCSTIFAYYDKGWKSFVIAFDESCSRLITVSCACLTRGIRRDVLFADESQDGWIENGKWHGLDFIVNDKSLLKSIKKGNDISLYILDKCKALQTTETFNGWINLDTNRAIEKLIGISAGFHDGIIKNIEHDGKDINVTYDCWSCRITIKYVDIIQCNEGSSISWGNNCILEAKMCFENGNIKWYVDAFCFDEYDNQECYFVSRSAQYKVELRNSF